MKRNLVIITVLLIISGCNDTSNVISNPTPEPVKTNFTLPQASPTFIPETPIVIATPAIPVTIPSPTTGNTTDNLKIKNLITQKCTYCHSIKPNSSSGYYGPPEGVVLDTYEQMVQMAKQIKREVNSRQMPRIPITMTDEERTMIDQWSAN